MIVYVFFSAHFNLKVFPHRFINYKIALLLLRSLQSLKRYATTIHICTRFNDLICRVFLLLNRIHEYRSLSHDDNNDNGNARLVMRENAVLVTHVRMEMIRKSFLGSSPVWVDEYGIEEYHGIVHFS